MQELKDINNYNKKFLFELNWRLKEGSFISYENNAVTRKNLRDVLLLIQVYDNELGKPVHFRTKINDHLETPILSLDLIIKKLTSTKPRANSESAIAEMVSMLSILRDKS